MVQADVALTQAQKLRNELRGGCVKLGTESWSMKAPFVTDTRHAFRPFSRLEMEEVRGSMAKEVQKDLRAVHFVLGEDRPCWATTASWGARRGAWPEKSTMDQTKTQVRLGDAETDYTSDSRAALRSFSKAEVDEARGAMSQEVRKDLRAVHIFASHNNPEWRSDAMSVGRRATSCTPPERRSNNPCMSHVHFGRDPPELTSGSRAALRKFTRREMEEVRGAVPKEVQKDLRAVHFTLGTDKTILDGKSLARRNRPRSAAW